MDTSKNSSLDNFLEFNGKRIATLRKDANWWVAIKPICEALNVNYNRQFQNIKSDGILKAVFAIQQIQIPGDQGREMLCLPEKYVYGWLFSINSESAELKRYKRKCYDILFEYFHGALTGRQKHLEERLDVDYIIQAKQEELENSETFKEIQELKKRRSLLSKQLNEMDKELANGQMRIVFN